MTDAPAIRAESSAAEQIRDLSATVEHLDAYCRELRRSLAEMVDDYSALKSLAADPSEWERVRIHVLKPEPLPILTRARRALRIAPRTQP